MPTCEPVSFCCGAPKALMWSRWPEKIRENSTFWYVCADCYNQFIAKEENGPDNGDKSKLS